MGLFPRLKKRGLIEAQLLSWRYPSTAEFPRMNERGFIVLGCRYCRRRKKGREKEGQGDWNRC